MRRVEVHWEDVTHRPGWQDRDKAVTVNTLHITTVGYLLTSDKKYIRLATDYGEELDRVCDVNVIPRGCITKIVTLKPLQRKK